MRTKIIGIALAAIMLASVFVAFIGSTGAYSTGGPYNIIDRNAPAGIQKVLRGQDLEFVNFASTPTVYRIVDNNIENTYISTNNRLFDVNWPSTGAYYVNYGAADERQLSVEDASVPLTLKVGTKTVSSIAVGSLVVIDTGGLNLFNEDRVDLKVIGPDGQIKTDTINNQVFTNISVQTLATTFGTAGINTAGWKLGSYTIQIATKPENACGLDKNSGDPKSLTIIKGEIDISAAKTSVVQDAVLKLTVTGVAYDAITVAADPANKNVEFQAGTDDTQSTWCTANKDCFTHSIDEDGKRTYAVKFLDTGSYTIKVTITSAGARNGDYDTVDITVSERAVTFDVPSTVVIGEKFTLAGTANTGERVDIAIDDSVYAKTNDLVVDENGEFSVEIDTATAGIAPLTVPGSVRLKAYINRDAPLGVGIIGAGESDDGSVAILMTRGDLIATVSDTAVAQDDDFVISGTAKGSKSVNILIVSPKGSGGDKIDGTGAGLYDATASISEIDNSFTKKISVGDDVDTGTYAIAVLSPGSDAVYNGLPPGTGVGNFVAVLKANYVTTAKTQEQLLDIVMDSTIDAAGSDDLLVLLTVKVEAAFVRLDPVATVGVGSPMVVSGSTNREEGFAIVVTAKGPSELAPKTVMVENGKFNATFDTTGAKEGMYTVKADDGDGHTDEVTASISGTAPSPTATVSPTATPAPTATPTVPPTATPTPTPATPTPATPTPEEPGFEAVFAIAGLLAIAYLVLRIRK